MKSSVLFCTILFTFFLGCSGPKPNLDIEAAKLYGLAPFAPSGGYEIGSIVILENDLPVLSTGVELLESRGNFQPSSDPRELPARSESQSSLFRADLQAAQERNEISSSAASELERLSSFEINITSARRSYLSEGRAGLTSWLYDLDLNNADDYRTLRIIHDTHEGQQKYLITEVIEVREAIYTAEWRRDLSADAQASFLSFFGTQGNIEWENGGKAVIRITPETPILVAYKSYKLPMDRIEQALKTRSWD